MTFSSFSSAPTTPAQCISLSFSLCPVLCSLSPCVSVSHLYSVGLPFNSIPGPLSFSSTLTMKISLCIRHLLYLILWRKSCCSEMSDVCRGRQFCWCCCTARNRKRRGQKRARKRWIQKKEKQREMDKRGGLSALKLEYAPVAHAVKWCIAPPKKKKKNRVHWKGKEWIEMSWVRFAEWRWSLWKEC